MTGEGAPVGPEDTRQDTSQGFPGSLPTDPDDMRHG